MHTRPLMVTIKNFEDLEVWKLARELVNLIYRDFHSCKDYNLKNQITSAGLSIKNNIAEGFSRSSDKEFRHFLNISKGSCSEVRSIYYTAEDQNFISGHTANDRSKRVSVIITKITNLMYYLQKNNKPE